MSEYRSSLEVSSEIERVQREIGYCESRIKKANKNGIEYGNSQTYKQASVELHEEIKREEALLEALKGKLKGLKSYDFSKETSEVLTSTGEHMSNKEFLKHILETLMLKYPGRGITFILGVMIGVLYLNGYFSEDTNNATDQSNIVVQDPRILNVHQSEIAQVLEITSSPQSPNTNNNHSEPNPEKFKSPEAQGTYAMLIKHVHTLYPNKSDSRKNNHTRKITLAIHDTETYAGQWVKNMKRDFDEAEKIGQLLYAMILIYKGKEADIRKVKLDLRIKGRLSSEGEVVTDADKLVFLIESGFNANQ